MSRIVFSLTLGLALVSAAARAESTVDRVTVIDGLELTPSLEKTGARSKMHEAVVATVKQHGWEPALSEDCHDLGCVGVAAATAGASYAVILIGRFLPHQDGAEVRASLWHDGFVIAERTEADEEKDFERLHMGTFLRCGNPGFCTTVIANSKFVQYTGRLLDDEAAARRERARVAEAAKTPPVAVVVPTPAPTLVQPASPPATRSPADARMRTVIGWTLVGAGVGLGAGALALWSWDGSTHDCADVGNGAQICRRSRSTTTAAAVMGGAGLLAAGGGVVVLLLGRGSSDLALAVHPSGLSLRGRF
jgi:hypothetical protein